MKSEYLFSILVILADWSEYPAPAPKLVRASSLAALAKQPRARLTSVSQHFALLYIVCEFSGQRDLQTREINAKFQMLNRLIETL